MAVVREQTGTIAYNDGGTSISCSLSSSVADTSLVVVQSSSYRVDNDPYGTSDCAQTGGTGTAGTITRDVQAIWEYTSGAYASAALYSCPVSSAGTLTFTISSITSGGYTIAAAAEYSGADTSGTRVANTATGQGSSGAPTTSSFASGGAGVFIGCLFTATSGSTTHTPGADYTQIVESEDGSTHSTGGSEDRIVTADTTDAADWTAPTSVPWLAVMAFYKAGATLSREQEGFRFYADDAAAGSATPLANQDVDVSVAKGTNFRLRVLGNMTGDAPSEAATLQYKKSGDAASEWETIA